MTRLARVRGHVDWSSDAVIGNPTLPRPISGAETDDVVECVNYHWAFPDKHVLMSLDFFVA